jgi:hypothetical protein
VSRRLDSRSPFIYICVSVFTCVSKILLFLVFLFPYVPNMFTTCLADICFSDMCFFEMCLMHVSEWGVLGIFGPLNLRGQICIMRGGPG